MDWFNEIWNGLVFHFTNYAPVWGAPARTAYLILIGLNIEICFMFAIAGHCHGEESTGDRDLKMLGCRTAGSSPWRPVFCVVVELLLNAVGALTWDYSWWNVRAPGSSS